MKTTRINLIAALTVIFLALSSFVPVSMAANNKPVLTKNELKVLLRTAKEPPEHRKIAEYYRQEAQRLTASAKEHAELATIYEQTHPFPAMESKHGNTFGQGASHCKKFASLQAEAAKESEALATLHEDMAKTADQKQQ